MARPNSKNTAIPSIEEILPFVESKEHKPITPPTRQVNQPPNPTRPVITNEGLRWYVPLLTKKALDINSNTIKHIPISVTLRAFSPNFSVLFVLFCIVLWGASGDNISRL